MMRITDGTTTVKVWDLPIRLFHWVLVALVAALWASGELGKLELHMRLGQAVLAMLLFRLAWGLVGSPTARFSHFVRGPAAVAAYLRAARQGTVRSIGHNPLGGYSVLALLTLLLVQGTSGLFTTDDIATDGPLVHLVASKTAAALSTVHRIGFKVLLGLVALHLAAVLFYRLVKKDDLVRAMITGEKKVPEGVHGIRYANPLLALALLAGTAALVVGMLAVFGR